MWTEDTRVETRNKKYDTRDGNVSTMMRGASYPTDWSWKILTQGERNFYWYLASFPGNFQEEGKMGPSAQHNPFYRPYSHLSTTRAPGIVLTPSLFFSLLLLKLYALTWYSRDSLCYGFGARVAYINAIMGYYFLGLARRTKTLFALLYSLV